MIEATQGERIDEIQKLLRSVGALLSGLGQGAAQESGAASSQEAGAASSGGAMETVAPAVGNRRLVYVHGICPHAPGYSDSWWKALEPFVGQTFGPGVRGQTRLEVLWSDVVSEAKGAHVAVAAGGGPNLEQARTTEEIREQERAAKEIREVLFDRADRHALEAGPKHVAGAAPLALADARGFISVPGEDCVKDFAIYLVNDAVRQRVLDQFTQVVKPLLAGGLQVDVVSHSWGTVVAYEALRQMGDDGATQALVRNFFTVGAALSIGPVKMRLRQANQDGRRPANVRRWVNLNALGDVVGGPLKQRPFQVDLDFPNLDPYGCGNFFGIVNPACAHGSYFQAGNLPVNRDIFGAFIESK